ncbi:MAG TPA: ribokinase, partial [Allocoleopsis sp.]
MSILIFGSINLDLVTRTPRLPQTGETLTGHSFTTIPGGKGANQAVAVARLGVSAEMVGRLGNDRFGQELLASLQAAGVGCDRIQIDASTSSGIAVIAVDDRGENHIIIIPGANGQVGSDDVDRLRGLLPGAKALLLQLEIPQSAVMAAATAAKQARVPVILDPAPAPTEFYAELYRAIDIITPNQTEAAALVGFAIDSLAEATQAAQVLHQRGITTVIIKLGNQGAFCSTLQAEVKEQFMVPAFSVQVVDTVAAGDAFNGGLAVALAEGYSLRDAVHWASGVAALSVT